MKKLMLVFGVLVLLSLIALNYFGIHIQFSATGEKQVGNSQFVQAHLNKPLPNFRLTDLAGRPINSLDLRGKRVHINFWSTSCKPCLNEFAELNRLTRHYSKEYVFLAFAPEDSTRVSRILHKHPLAYRVIPGAGTYFAQLGVDAYPKNFFIDSQGIVRRVVEGSQQAFDPATLTLTDDNFRRYRNILDALK